MFVDNKAIGEAVEGGRQLTFDLMGVRAGWLNSTTQLLQALKDDAGLEGTCLLSLFEDIAGDDIGDIYHGVVGNLDPTQGPIWALAYDGTVEDVQDDNEGQTMHAVVLDTVPAIEAKIQAMRVEEAQRIVASIGVRVARTVGKDPVAAHALVKALCSHPSTQVIGQQWTASIVQDGLEQQTAAADPAGGARKPGGSGRL